MDSPSPAAKKSRSRIANSDDSPERVTGGIRGIVEPLGSAMAAAAATQEPVFDVETELGHTIDEVMALEAEPEHKVDEALACEDPDIAWASGI